MLHVTNGDVAAGVLRAAGMEGDILPWRDVLHEGPVRADLPLEELSKLRARFIAEAGWANREVAEAQLVEAAHHVGRVPRAVVEHHAPRVSAVAAGADARDLAGGEA